MAKRFLQIIAARTTDRRSALSGHRRWHLRQASSLDGRAATQDRGRSHGTGCVGGDGGWQARHQHRAVYGLAAQRMLRRVSIPQPTPCREVGIDAAHRGAACEASRSCTPAAVARLQRGRTGAAHSTGRPDRRAAAAVAGAAGRGLPSSPRGARVDCGRADLGSTTLAGRLRMAIAIRSPTRPTCLERLVSGSTKSHQLEQLLPWNWRPPGAPVCDLFWAAFRPVVAVVFAGPALTDWDDRSFPLAKDRCGIWIIARPVRSRSQVPRVGTSRSVCPLRRYGQPLPAGYDAGRPSRPYGSRCRAL